MEIHIPPYLWPHLWLAGSLVAAAALAAAATIAVAIVNPSGQPRQAIPARIVSARPSAHAVLREVDARGELALSGIAPATPGETYEVWVRLSLIPI